MDSLRILVTDLNAQIPNTATTMMEEFLYTIVASLKDQIPNAATAMTDELLYILCWSRVFHRLCDSPIVRAMNDEERYDIFSVAMRLDTAWSTDILNNVPVMDMARLKADIEHIDTTEHSRLDPIEMYDLVYVKTACCAITNFSNSAAFQDLDMEMRCKVDDIRNQLSKIWSHSLFIEPMDLSGIREAIKGLVE